MTRKALYCEMIRALHAPRWAKRLAKSTWFSGAPSALHQARKAGYLPGIDRNAVCNEWWSGHVLSEVTYVDEKIQ